MRNRAAASRFRAKLKTGEKQLESDAQEMEDLHVALAAEEMELRKQVQLLRILMLQHVDCCPP